MYENNKSSSHNCPMNKKVNCLIRNAIFIIGISFFSANILAAKQPRYSALESGVDDFLNVAPYNTGNKGLLDYPDSFFKPKQYEIRSLIKQGFGYLEEGKKQQGLEKLNQAWAMDSSLPVAGVIISHFYLQEKKYSSALDTAKKIQKKSPYHAEGYTLAGLAYVGMNKQKQSKSSFEKALQVQPGDPDAGLNLARVYFKQGVINKARDVLAEVLRYYPNHLQAISSQIELELKTHQLERAISLVKPAMLVHPNELQLHLLLAQIHQANNESIKTLAVLEKAMEQFPGHVELMQYVAVVQLQRGEPNKAISILKSAIKLSPDYVLLHYNLALNYEQLKQFPLAKDEINKALKLDSAHTPSKFVLARLMVETGKLDEAKTILKQLDKIIPKSSGVSDIRGRIAFSQNNMGEAITHFKIAVEKNVNDPFLIAKLSMAQFKANKNDAGYETLYHWINEHPKDISIRFILADRLLDNGRYVDAQKYYREIIKIEPESIVASNNVAWILAGTGQQEKALDLAKENYAKAAENVFVIDTLATILLKKGEIKKAIDLLKKATKIAPNNTTVSYHLAEAFVGQDNTKAKIILTNLLSNNKFFKERKLTEELLLKLN